MIFLHWNSTDIQCCMFKLDHSLYVAYSLLSIPCLLMPSRLKEPGINKHGIEQLNWNIPSTTRMFLSLDLLSEYWIQHGAIGPLYVTSSYSSWIFCRGVSGFAIDCPCDVWCPGLNTCLLHVGPPFGNRFLNISWAVGLTYWIVYLNSFFCILTYAIIYVLIHHIIFGFIFILLNYSLFFQVLLY